MQIENDIEFYCYLKKNLPKDYHIIAIPSTKYYSEWLFEYNIFRGDILYKQYKGDFRSIEKGKLVNEAKQLIQCILKGE
jgi:hypothetical protein